MLHVGPVRLGACDRAFLVHLVRLEHAGVQEQVELAVNHVGEARAAVELQALGDTEGTEAAVPRLTFRGGETPRAAPRQVLAAVPFRTIVQITQETRATLMAMSAIDTGRSTKIQ